MLKFVITLKEITQELCVCRACELSIKRSMKIKDNGEVYKLWKTCCDASCLLEEELAYGWLVSDVVECHLY